MGIRIICDSTCDLTGKEAEKLGVTLVPLKVLFGEEEYLDGVTIAPAEFYAKLKEAKELPKTSQPSPDSFLELFRQAKEEGDEVLCILLASNLSGTFQSACLAKDMADYDKIYVLDSETATLGCQLLIQLAVKLVKEGLSAAEIFDILEKKKKQVRIFMVVDTLEYLKKGGRLSTAGMIAGKVLNLKPVISVYDGTPHVTSVARGKKSAWEKIFKMIHDEQADLAKGYYIGYTGETDNSEEFAGLVREKYAEKERGVVTVGSVIGVHVGPGANGIAVFVKGHA